MAKRKAFACPATIEVRGQRFKVRSTKGACRAAFYSLSGSVGSSSGSFTLARADMKALTRLYSKESDAKRVRARLEKKYPEFHFGHPKTHEWRMR